MVTMTTTSDWQTALAQAITDPRQLLTALKLSPEQLLISDQACLDFPLRVPQGFVKRMQPGDPYDPLLRQVLPIRQELMLVAGFNRDPLKEQQVNPIPGLLHKYYGRVLLTMTGTCAIHCRYCFRRHFPYSDNNPGTQGWQQAMQYIAKDPSITEVILSGGDPLLIKDEPLSLLIKQLAEIKHVERLRIHSRLPIVLPERITDSLISCLTQTPLQPIMVIHCNHPKEIDASVKIAMKKFQTANITLFNQSVLLKGVNDDAKVLIALSKALFNIGVIPYYLHLLDRVQGAAHFEVSEKKARALYADIIKNLPGYLVPKLVREEAGAAAKSTMSLRKDSTTRDKRRDDLTI